MKDKLYTLTAQIVENNPKIEASIMIKYLFSIMDQLETRLTNDKEFKNDPNTKKIINATFNTIIESLVLTIYYNYIGESDDFKEAVEQRKDRMGKVIEINVSKNKNIA